MPTFFRSYVKPKGSSVLVLDAMALLAVLVRDAPEEERAHFPLVRYEVYHLLLRRKFVVFDEIEFSLRILLVVFAFDLSLSAAAALLDLPL